jgi:predicted nuclease of predicted toxin-antitoxin system
VKILLDECVPLPLREILDRHTCHTAQQMGWKNTRNGELLDLAEGEFDLFIIADQGVRYQQNLTGRRIKILELSTNKLRLIEAATSQIKEAVDSIGPTEFQRLEIPNRPRSE